MTPAEHARQIERQEFEAECAAIRERAYALLAGKPSRNQQVERWIKRQEPKGSLKPRPPRKAATDKTARTHARKAKLYSAFGHTRTLKEWAEATGLSSHTIRSRLARGWTIEDALTGTVNEAGKRMQKAHRPGVSSNFGPSDGTGAGSTLQASDNITFSEKA
ncbi:hypothetical protein GCM10011491_01480 [Brucella endophytica]|uniref:Uncharacterized protein n=1 Tax=Brucella endophytica TaxID=1963359 RepID=A0A916S0G7_9HYPH|nr:hypothetical protein [Brucella endophytica]GGA78003.1 hypothetical protein GCM10011491_01480 [Brucella endophytica]